jgi:PAS domain-containing protein
MDGNDRGQMHRIGIEVLERSARGGTWWYDLETEEIFWSEGLCRLFGVERGEGAPDIESALSFYTPEARELIVSAIARARETGDGYNLTVEMCRADGKRRYVQTIG